MVTKGTAGTTVPVRTSLSVDLHARLRTKAFGEHLTVRAALVEAVEAWVAPGRHRVPAGPSRAQVLEAFDQATGPKDARARIAALWES